MAASTDSELVLMSVAAVVLAFLLAASESVPRA
jgi:hypothetical protein